MAEKTPGEVAVNFDSWRDGLRIRNQSANGVLLNASDYSALAKKSTALCLERLRLTAQKQSKT